MKLDLIGDALAQEHSKTVEAIAPLMNKAEQLNTALDMMENALTTIYVLTPSEAAEREAEQDRLELVDAGFYDEDLTDDADPDQDIKPDPGSIGDQLGERQIQEWSMRDGWL